MGEWEKQAPNLFFQKERGKRENPYPGLSIQSSFSRSSETG